MKLYKVNDIPGLYYTSRIPIVKDVIKNLDKINWLPITNSSNSRCVQHYGYKYNYKTSDISEKTDELPDFLCPYKIFLEGVCSEIDSKKDFNNYFNQCIVNNYNPGQGISKHIDNTSYGDIIGCYTLGSGCYMRFTNNNNNDDYIDVYVKPNSLYIMSGDARYKWKHEMIPAQYDVVESIKIPRGRRISLTFRNV